MVILNFGIKTDLMVESSIDISVDMMIGTSVFGIAGLGESQPSASSVIKPKA